MRIQNCIFHTEHATGFVVSRLGLGPPASRLLQAALGEAEPPGARAASSSGDIPQRDLASYLVFLSRFACRVAPKKRLNCP